jgi:arginase
MTLLHFPQWQGGAKVRALMPASQHLRQRFLSHIGDSPLPVLNIPIVDVGDRMVENNIAYRAVVLQQLSDALAVLQQAAPDRAVTLGGDCGVETVPIGYANLRANGQMALVWIDAHGDLNTPDSSPSKHYHGMVLRALCGEGDADFVACVLKPLTPDQVFMVGLRDLDAPEREFIQGKGIYHTPDIDLPALIEEIRQRGYSQVYVHFDMDGLNPDVFPYMSYPTSGGLTIEQITEMLVALHQHFEIVGMSLTEYASETGEGLHLLDPILAQAAAIVKSET